jgi:GT2 family glycosyltransferase
MGSLLGYEKTRQIQAAKHHRKKLLRPFPVSERVGLQHARSFRASVFRRPATRRVFFLLRHRISFVDQW